MLKIIGANTHNLKNISIDIPRNKLVIITGVSGSGKSSLAFGTIFAEGQRRYVESLSPYARQFLSMMDKPDVDSISGLSPAISIEQRTTSHNPRSTVGTITEIADYMRLLFARVGVPFCPEHKVDLNAKTVSEIKKAIFSSYSDGKVQILAPVVQQRKGSFHNKIQQFIHSGYLRFIIDGYEYTSDNEIDLNPKIKHDISVVVDRVVVKESNSDRIVEAIEKSAELADGILGVLNHETKEIEIFSTKHSCPHCNFCVPKLEPTIFSFNNPKGACVNCDGLGYKTSLSLESLIYDNSMTLAQGVIIGWGRSDPENFSLLRAVCNKLDISMDVPFRDLTIDEQNIVLYGSKKQLDLNLSYSKLKYFKGIVNIIEYTYHNSTEDRAKEDLNKFFMQSECDVCCGYRLSKTSLSVQIDNKNIAQVSELSLSDLLIFINQINFVGMQKIIADKILKEIQERLYFLVNVGLSYLSLNRRADTLSGGEMQRIRLASQIGSGLVGVIYILDEPSIGLHQRDNARLLDSLRNLTDLGNTVLVVEHDAEAILAADHIIDIGPSAGIHGGEVVAQGSLEDIINSPKSLTSKYLTGALKIEMPKQAILPGENFIELNNLSLHNLKNVSVKFPVGLMTCVTGVSGSGKSTLVADILLPVANHILNKASLKVARDYISKISGLNFMDKVVSIDQAPIGRTPRSNPATYTGLFAPIRDVFAKVQTARTRGYKPGRFSFNVRGGRCEACQGDGVVKVEMHFLSDIYVKCDQCQGARYNEATLQVYYRNKNISNVLEMTVTEAAEFFSDIPQIQKKLQLLIKVGLGYVKLGQSATTLSGGEAQRIKIAKELARRDTGDTLYILDEPTTGLHFDDVAKLIQVLAALRDRGNTIIIIEHNLDLVKNADWIVDLGPEGGINGGEIMAQGTVSDIIDNEKSYTSQYLKELLTSTSYVTMK